MPIVASFNSKSSDKDILAFYRAAIEGDIKGIDSFIKKYGRESVDLQTSGHEKSGTWNASLHTALTYAVMQKAPMETIRKLAAYGADPNKNDNTGIGQADQWDAVKWALHTRYFEALEFFITEMKADVNKKSSYGSTLLMDAVDMSYSFADADPYAARHDAGAAAVALLLPVIKDIDAKNRHGKTARDIAAEKSPHLVAAIDQLKARKTAPANKATRQTPS